MIEEISPTRWRYLGCSVRGANHVRSGLPNQDAIDHFPESGQGLPLILAIADGHGSAKSFRSDIGSQLAVATATRILTEFVQAQSSVDQVKLKGLAQDLLPQKLVEEWTKAVEDHRQENPISEEERQKLRKEEESVRQAIKQRPLLAYGATLLAVLVTETYILYLQLGDGDILEVNEQGHTTRPLPRDPRLIANETTSLCIPKAWEEFQIQIYPHETREIPVLILVSTDGYANSFSSDAEFFEIGNDYLEMIRSRGLESLESRLEGFLEQTSAGGSGDDITLGILRRVEKLDKDHTHERLTQLEDNSRSMMNRQTENTAEVDNRLSQFNQSIKQQKKTNNALFRLMGGLMVALGLLTILSLALGAWSFLRINQVEQRIKALEPKQPQQEGSKTDTKTPSWEYKPLNK